MKKPIIFIGIIIVIIGAIVLLRSGQESNTPDDVINSEPDVMQPSVQEDSSAIEAGDTEPTTAGSYEEWSPEKTALAADHDVVIFFHASWCPSCRALDKNIKENENDIPSDLVILKADYDTATEMKQQYGITTQHTLVQIDQDGSMITKWSGGSRISDITEKLQ